MSWVLPGGCEGVEGAAPLENDLFGWPILQHDSQTHVQWQVQNHASHIGGQQACITSVLYQKIHHPYHHRVSTGIRRHTKAQENNKAHGLQDLASGGPTNAQVGGAGAEGRSMHLGVLLCSNSSTESATSGMRKDSPPTTSSIPGPELRLDGDTS